MFSHVVLGTNDLAKAKTFYDAVIGATGGAPAIELPGGTRIVYRHNGGTLLITLPIDGQPATIANGATLGFAMASPEELMAWHAAGLAHGGTACEDPPGLRDSFKAYLAYLRDPDGNKLCAMHVPA